MHQSKEKNLYFSPMPHFIRIFFFLNDNRWNSFKSWGVSDSVELYVFKTQLVGLFVTFRGKLGQQSKANSLFYWMMDNLMSWFEKQTALEQLKVARNGSKLETWRVDVESLTFEKSFSLLNLPFQGINWTSMEKQLPLLLNGGQFDETVWKTNGAGAVESGAEWVKGRR